MSIKQKDAVVNAVTSVLGSLPAGAVVLDKDQKAHVREIVAAGILSGEVAYSKPLDEAEVKKYVVGLVDNHLRKAKELNGNKAYAPAKEGTKRDPQLRELEKLLKSGQFAEGTAECQQVKTAIDNRKQELKAAQSSKKVPKVEDIDLTTLPQEVQDILH